MALEGAVEQARSLEVAQHKASMYSPLSFSVFHSTTVSVTDPRVANDSEEVIASAKITAATKTCFYCGRSLHTRYTCSARNTTCHEC